MVYDPSFFTSGDIFRNFFYVLLVLEFHFTRHRNTFDKLLICLKTNVLSFYFNDKLLHFCLARAFHFKITYYDLSFVQLIVEWYLGHYWFMLCHVCSWYTPMIVHHLRSYNGTNTLTLVCLSVQADINQEMY